MDSHFQKPKVVDPRDHLRKRKSSFNAIGSCILGSSIEALMNSKVPCPDNYLSNFLRNSKTFKYESLETSFGGIAQPLLFEEFLFALSH